MAQFPGGSSSSSKTLLKSRVRFQLNLLCDLNSQLRDAHVLVVNGQRKLSGCTRLLDRHVTVYEHMYREGSESKDYDSLFLKFLSTLELRREVSETGIRVNNAIKSFRKISASYQKAEDMLKSCLAQLEALGADVSNVPEFGCCWTLPPPLSSRSSGRAWHGYSSTRQAFNLDRDVWASCLGHHVDDMSPLACAWASLRQSDRDNHRARNPDLSSGSWTAFDNTSHNSDNNKSDDPGSSGQKPDETMNDQDDTPPKTSARPKPAATKPPNPYDEWRQRSALVLSNQHEQLTEFPYPPPYNCREPGCHNVPDGTSRPRDPCCHGIKMALRLAFPRNEVDPKTLRQAWHPSKFTRGRLPEESQIWQDQATAVFVMAEELYQQWQQSKRRR